MTDPAERIDSYFVDHKQEFLSLVQSLVEQETPSDKAESFTELWNILRENFEETGYTVEHIEGRTTAGQLLCKPAGFDPSSPIQLILGHTDTVWDIGTLEEMPFEVEGNNVSGPGIFDMKAGIAMMVFVLKALKEVGEQPEVQPVFLINSDEEIGSNESRDLIFEQAKLAERTFVLEPALGTEGKIKTRRKGVGDFEIMINGKPSHAGIAPGEGVSAILGLSHIVQQLYRLNKPSEGITVNVGTIEGGERSNVIAAKSKAVVDVRIPTREDGERIKEEIYNLKPEIDGIELTVKGDINRPPLEKNSANQKLWEITKKLGEKLGLELKEGMSGGASDGNYTSLHSPTIDGLGAVGEGAHAFHEKIFLDETLKRAGLLALLLLYPSISE